MNETKSVGCLTNPFCDSVRTAVSHNGGIDHCFLLCCLLIVLDKLPFKC